MKFEAKPTGSITDKLLSILEGATVLVQTAKKIEAKIGSRSTVTLAKHEVITITKQLREGAVMIDNLLSIIEQREMPKLDKFTNVITSVPLPAPAPAKAKKTKA